jgi:uncharacterized membrane protein
VTLIRFFWTFNVAYSEWILAGVIWMIGWCMVLLAPIVYVCRGLKPATSARIIAIAGLLLIVGQYAFSEVPAAEGATGWLARVFITFGRVPMFFYLLHIPLIHVLALGVNQVRTGAMHHEWYSTAPYTAVPDEHQWSLPLLYLIFIVATTVLYPVCRWFSHYKATHDAAWLRLI